MQAASSPTQMKGRAAAMERREGTPPPPPPLLQIVAKMAPTPAINIDLRAAERRNEDGTEADVGCDNEVIKGELQEAQSSDDDRREMSERPVKISTTKESWSMAWKKSLKQQIHQTHQVICGSEIETTASELEKIKKRLSNYSVKAFLFAVLMLAAYLVQQFTSAPFSTGEFASFVTVVLLSLIVSGAIVVRLPPKRGNAMVCISCLLLELASCILVLSCHWYYGFAILLVLLLIIGVALLQLHPKVQPTVQRYVLSPYFGLGDTARENQQDLDDLENQHLDHLFELPQGIANSGGLVTLMFAHYMDITGSVNPTGFLFFCTVALALYLMMVITVRAVSLPHATCLIIVLIVLLGGTIIAASISVGIYIHDPGSTTSQAVKGSKHRKLLLLP